MSEEDLLAKYKRLLALARNSLEANQVSLTTKDKQISQLTAALEDEKEKVQQARIKQKTRDLDETSQFPKSFIRRVDVNNQIWMLAEYDGSPDNWISFNNENDLKDYIQRIPGSPLLSPHRCLSEDESTKIENDAKLKIERIIEEFRRYKVKVEISKKQRDADSIQSPDKELVQHNDLNISNHNNSFDGQSSKHDLSSDLDIRKWIAAYERVARENEQLRTQSSDSLLVKKWQERYEEIMKEKEDLVSKLKIFTRSNE